MYNNKVNFMNKTEEVSEKEEVQLLQWIKGEKAGKIEEVIGVKENFTMFKGGGRINTTLINEIMMDVSNGEALDIKDLQTAASADSAINLKRVHNNTKPTISSTTSQPHKQDNPIEILIKKSKKKIEQHFTVTLQCNVPSSELIEFLLDSFEEDEVIEVLQKYIQNQIKNELIHEAFINEIKEYIKR